MQAVLDPRKWKHEDREFLGLEAAIAGARSLSVVPNAPAPKGISKSFR